MSLSAFLDYLQLEKNYSRLTVKAYRKDLEDFIEFIRDRYDTDALEEVNYSQIRSWIVGLSENGISNRSINRKISSLKSYYKFLLRCGDIQYSPLAKHRSLKTSKKVQIPFSEDEVMKVLQNIEATTFEGARDRFIVELFYSTGIRRIELIEIRLNDLDLGSSTLKVLGKRNKERFIPILESVRKTALDYLSYRSKLEIIKDEQHLFLNGRGEKLNETFVYRIINNYFSEVSGKLKKSPHILRHSFATHLLNQGANLNSVKELLGHASLAATQIYTHNSIAELSKIHQQAHPRNSKD